MSNEIANNKSNRQESLALASQKDHMEPRNVDVSRLEMLLRSKKDRESKRKLKNMLLRTRKSQNSKSDDPLKKIIWAALALRN